MIGRIAAVLLIAAVSFFWFPGHTILQSDTQIYIPILEHLEDESALKNDIMAVRPHVTFTLYDEVSLTLRRLTDLSFEQVLLGQQFVYRAIGIAGLLLLATGAGLPLLPAIAVTAAVSLGAIVYGPTVLTVEYEPVPRGFAFSFLLLSLGLLAQSRWRACAVAAAIAWCFHPPTATAYAGLLCLVLIWRKRWIEAAILFTAPAILLLTMLGNNVGPERPPIFARLTPEIEAIQRMRSSYNFVSLWIDLWWKHLSLMAIAAAVSVWRVWPRLSPELRVFFAGLPAIGVISAPASVLLLETMKWAVAPQYQFGRYLMFIAFFAALASAMAGAFAALRSRWTEAAAFWFIAFLIPLAPDFTKLSALHAGIAAGLAIMAAFVRYSPVAVAAAVLPFILIPTVGKVVTAPTLHSAELNELASWARVSTPKDAVFQFADVRRGLEPGVFRARAMRAIWADWKSGGQSNFMNSFATEWARRWKIADKPQTLAKYRELGIDYVVFSAPKAPKDAPPVFSNARWTVFQVRSVSAGNGL